MKKRTLRKIGGKKRRSTRRNRRNGRQKAGQNAIRILSTAKTLANPVKSIAQDVGKSYFQGKVTNPNTYKTLQNMGTNNPVKVNVPMAWVNTQNNSQKF
jgi:hypothetical protein